jgi:2-polyprenyl-3-methyl-5-hydroxy-6-metoxy-1,4-benzoquinol methylase
MVKIKEENINTKNFWNEKHSQRQPHNRNIADQFNRFFSMGFLPSNEEFSLLDIGCGNADHFDKLSKKYPLVKWFGTDLSSVITEKNKSLFPRGTFRCIDIEKEEINENFDYIVSMHTFEHLSDPVAVVKNIINHCRKNVIILVPYATAWNGDKSHVHSFSIDEPFKNYESYKIVNNDKEIFYGFKGKAK